jgi:uncharacterized NAD(P)/FAD-binding protein YdhS
MLGYPEKIDGGDFLQRSLFGRYLADVLDEARSEAVYGVTLEIIIGEAMNLEETGDGARILLADGRILHAQSVVLALGNLPGEYPIRRPLAFYRSKRYVHSPLLATATNEIAPADHVLIVGAGLTAIDIAVQLNQLGHRGVVHALSRRGLRPKVHAAPSTKSVPQIFAGGLPSTVRETLRAIRVAAKTFEKEGGDWRAVVDSVRPYTQRLWQGFSHEERARFMRHVRPYWEVVRHRIAPKTAAIISEMERSGQLRYYAGRLVSLNEASDAVEAVIRERGTSRLIPISVKKVLNCTGPRTDYSKYQHPLLINLLAAGLISHDRLALGIQATPSGEIIRHTGEPVGWLYTLGAPLKGILWESTAVPEIRTQAAEIAKTLLGTG